MTVGRARRWCWWGDLSFKFSRRVRIGSSRWAPVRSNVPSAGQGEVPPDAQRHPPGEGATASVGSDQLLVVRIIVLSPSVRRLRRVRTIPDPCVRCVSMLVAVPPFEPLGVGGTIRSHACSGGIGTEAVG